MVKMNNLIDLDTCPIVINTSIFEVITPIPPTIYDQEPARTINLTDLSKFPQTDPPLFHTVPCWEYKVPQFLVVDFDHEEPDLRKRRLPFVGNYLCHTIRVLGGGVISWPEKPMIVIAKMAVNEDANRQALELYSSQFPNPIYREEFIWDSFRNKKVPRLKDYELWPNPGNYTPKYIELDPRLIPPNGHVEEGSTNLSTEEESEQIGMDVDPEILPPTPATNSVKTHTRRPTRNLSSAVKTDIPRPRSTRIPSPAVTTNTRHSTRSSSPDVTTNTRHSTRSPSPPVGNNSPRPSPPGRSSRSGSIYNRHGGSVGRVSPISDFEISDSESDPSSRVASRRQLPGPRRPKNQPNPNITHPEQEDLFNHRILPPTPATNSVITNIRRPSSLSSAVETDIPRPGSTRIPSPAVTSNTRHSSRSPSPAATTNTRHSTRSPSPPVGNIPGSSPAGRSHRSGSIYNRHGGSVGRVSPISDFEISGSESGRSRHAASRRPRQRPGTRRRKNHNITHSEQQDMINYIIRHNRHDEVKGKDLYVSMELAQVVPGRSWHTLNNNFRRTIAMPENLRSFRMSEADRAKLQRAINR